MSLELNHLINIDPSNHGAGHAENPRPRGSEDYGSHSFDNHTIDSHVKITAG